jgi:hypothetical protein
MPLRLLLEALADPAATPAIVRTANSNDVSGRCCHELNTSQYRTKCFPRGPIARTFEHHSGFSPALLVVAHEGKVLLNHAF